jgi:dimethylhistidine N-methyltransferase
LPSTPPPSSRFEDRAPASSAFRREVLSGLAAPQKEIPCKYLYDERGSQLFEEICELDEYYPTRTELAIMRDSIDEIAELLGPECLLIEYGSGSSLKTRILLDHMTDPAGYMPIDISRDHLLQTAEDLRSSYPELDVHPVCADYTAELELPETRHRPARRIVYFPGSTIGNFEPAPAEAFLKRIAKVCGRNGAVLIGVDLEKDEAILEAAYDDSQGVTAAFNLNLLERVNRELDADFDLDRFRHDARFSPSHGRVEMHLVSLEDQSVRIGDVEIPFEEGESIWTESSYKHSLERFEEIAAGGGLDVQHVWTDADELFSVQYLTLA